MRKELENGFLLDNVYDLEERLATDLAAAKFPAVVIN
jgi:hypothetical protein